MRRKVAIVLAALFYYSGLVHLVVWCRRLSRQNVIILNYHQALGGDLRRHLLYFRRFYRMLHLEEALEELYADSGKTQRKDQRTPLVITFDDGHRDNYTYAFALARELQIPLTIFIATGYTESGDNFWWLESKRMVEHTSLQEVTLEGSTYQLDDPEERESLYQMIDAHFHNAKSVAEREAFLIEMRSTLAVPLTFTAEEELLLPMNWEQIREMDSSGWVTFGAHTVHHPTLSCLADATEVQQEVSGCRVVLEKQLGHPVRAFAYPIGKPKDIGAKALPAVKEAGYSWAVTTVSGVNTPNCNPYQLLRLSSNVSDHWLLQAASVAGIWKFVSPKWRKTYQSSN